MTHLFIFLFVTIQNYKELLHFIYLISYTVEHYLAASRNLPTHIFYSTRTVKCTKNIIYNILFHRIRKGNFITFTGWWNNLIKKRLLEKSISALRNISCDSAIIVQKFNTMAMPFYENAITISSRNILTSVVIPFWTRLPKKKYIKIWIVRKNINVRKI